MRTEQEILARIEEIKERDWLGFERGDLISALSFDAAKPFLKPEATAEGWVRLDDPMVAIKEYMAFAWDKANNCRGLSAGRSMTHMLAWLWLAEENEFVSRMDLEDYSHYGKPQLRAICEHFEIDWRQYDDGRWANSESDTGVPPESVPAAA